MSNTLHLYVPGIAPQVAASMPTSHRSCAHAGCDKPLVYEGHCPLRQDVTNLWFMKVIAHYGSPDYFFTEYFRVNDTSRLNRSILTAITENDTGRPVFAQMIGESISDLVRTAKELCKYNIAGVDLNMGCPAPRIYRKNVGGGLLLSPEKVIAKMLGVDCCSHQKK